MIVRRLLVVGLAVLLSVQVVRTAAVSLPFEGRPASAAWLWPSHPAILIERSMAEIGTSAAKGQSVPAETLQRVEIFSRKAPLAEEPYLVKGALALTQGRGAAAEALLIEARTRNPRSAAARYLLADLYFRTNRIFPGLVEMAALSRLEPTSSGPFIPALAAYAKTPGAIPQLRKFFRSSPNVEAGVLSLLAADARNAELILALAGPRSGTAAQDSTWQGRIVGELVNAGDFAKAYSTWTQLAGTEPTHGLFNPRFRSAAAPPPFNWSFASGSAGLAEPIAGDQLQLIHYGRENAVLAGQLLVLRPGRYLLRMAVWGDAKPGTAQWAVRCAVGNATLLILPLRAGANSGSFAVPNGGCPAQWLELRGIASDPPQPVELTIGRLSLAKAAAS